MKTVTSKDNPVLKAAKKLRTRKGREEAGAFLAEGEKLISEAVMAGLAVEHVFINGGAVARGDVKAGEFANEIATRRGEAATGEYANEIALEEKLFLGLAGTVTPQPYMAVVKKPGDAYHGDGAVDRGKGFGMSKGPASCRLRALVFDRVGDPGNVGTMMRSALAAGFDAVWCTKGTADVFSDKAIRASAGAVFRLPAREGLSAEDCISLAEDIGARLIVCDAGGAGLYETDLTGSFALVIGSESAGPQDIFLEAAAAVVGIPMAEGVESLNAATAAAVVMYEALRQTEKEG